MTDLQKAKEGLIGHTISLAKDETVLFSEKKGIAPMIDFLSEGVDLTGFSVADLVVGKAVALLFVKSGITRVYAKVLSISGINVLEKYGVYYEYDALTEKIINRDKTDI